MNTDDLIKKYKLEKNIIKKLEETEQNKKELQNLHEELRELNAKMMRDFKYLNHINKSY